MKFYKTVIFKTRVAVWFQFTCELLVQKLILASRVKVQGLERVLVTGGGIRETLRDQVAVVYTSSVKPDIVVPTVPGGLG